MELFASDKCCGCGDADVELWFVDGDWFCRNCLWDRFYTFTGGCLYCAFNWERFMNRYPDGYIQLKKLFRHEPTTGENHVEEFVSENLEDYCDWALDFGDNERMIATTFKEVERMKQ